MIRPFLSVSIFCLFLGSILVSCRESPLPLKKFSSKDVKRVQVILNKLAPLIERKEAEKNMATLSFDELYEPLSSGERTFLRKFQELDPIKAGIKTKWRGFAEGKLELVRLEDQVIRKAGKEEKLAPQFVPQKTYDSYIRMMDAMEKDLGKSLRVESGYRSSAYQLYLFILYLKNHDYSILETAKWNALPGYSEHGDPNHQALDFINEEGINGEDNPEDFAVLPEYTWLTQNASRFGFVLSYPKDAEEGIAFEPWHWRYEESQDKQK